jgi:hypothetical protein
VEDGGPVPARTSLYLTPMPAPPSHAKPPGDDFVLWPDALGQSAGTVNETVIRRSLAGLAPTEWVEDPASQEPGEVEKSDPAAKEERFYPASRQWFRTTASIPPTDATEKWWQEGPSALPVPVVPPSEPPSVPESAVSSELLSPEEIWELAAEELEQASRLGAPAAPSASAAPTHAEKPPAHLPEVTLGAAAFASPPPAAPAVPSFAEAVGKVPSATLSAVVAPAELPVAVVPAASPAADLQEVPGRELAEAAASLEARLTRSLVTELPVVEAPAASAAPAAPTATVTQFPRADAPAEPDGLTAGATALPAAPVIAFPKPAFVAHPDRPLGMPAGNVGSASTPAAAALDSGAISDLKGGDPSADPTGRLPVEPLAAIPVPSRSPLSLRTEKSGTPLPTQRRKPIAAGGAEPVFADLGMATAAGPEIEEAAVAVEESTPGEVRSKGERRRRRKRAERQPPPEAARSGRSWVRWCAGTLGLLLVMAMVVAVVARDQLPSGWRRSAERWWQKAHQFVFPHQYGYPRRGVVPRAGEPPVIAPASSGPEAALPDAPAAAAPLEPASPPPLVEVPASAPNVSPVPAATAPPALPLLESINPPAVAPGRPTQPESETPEIPGGAAPVGEIFAPRAEPVPEDEDQTVPDEASAMGAQADSAQEPAPAAASDPAETASAAAPMASHQGADQAAVPEASSFTLWDGDAPPDAAGGPPVDGGTAVGRDTPPEAASAEVAEGKKAVQSLVAARSATEVLPWIFDADTLDSAVRSYYAQHPLQPLTEAVIEHEYSGIIPATGGKAHIFNVLAASHPRGFPVSAEATPQGYRIDWQSYIQWRDGWLRRFLDSKSENPQTLFVVLRRTHYFNDDVPKLDEKLAFKLTSAVPGDEGTVAFVDKNSAVGRSLADMYEWRTMYFPVVELQWVPSSKSGRYVRLNRIVRPTWRRIGE